MVIEPGAKPYEDAQPKGPYVVWSHWLKWPLRAAGPRVWPQVVDHVGLALRPRPPAANSQDLPLEIADETPKDWPLWASAQGGRRQGCPFRANGVRLSREALVGGNLGRSHASLSGTHAVGRDARKHRLQGGGAREVTGGWHAGIYGAPVLASVNEQTRRASGHQTPTAGRGLCWSVPARHCWPAGFHPQPIKRGAGDRDQDRQPSAGCSPLDREFIAQR